MKDKDYILFAGHSDEHGGLIGWKRGWVRFDPELAIDVVSKRGGRKFDWITIEGCDGWSDKTRGKWMQATNEFAAFDGPMWPDRRIEYLLGRAGRNRQRIKSTKTREVNRPWF